MSPKQRSEYNKEYYQYNKEKNNPQNPEGERFYVSRNGSLLPNKWAAHLTDKARAKHQIQDDWR